MNTQTDLPAALGTVRLPDLVRTDDLALMLGISRDGARRAILRGDLGPFLRIGRRLILRRESILQALQDRESLPTPAPGRPIPPRPRLEILDLLAGRRGGGRRG